MAPSPCPYMAKRLNSLHEASFLKIQIPHIGAESSQSNHFSKAPSLITTAMEIRFQNKFLRDTNTQIIEDG
jgi:hypothetical protein